MTERWIIAELYPSGARYASLRVVPEKTITVTRSGEASWQEGPLLRFRFPRVTNMVVAFDSSLAYTAHIPVSVIRKSIREPLSLRELEDTLLKTVSDGLADARKDAAHELLAEETDMILVRSRVTDLLIDNHRVLNPEGFRAQRVDALVELTFATREAHAAAERLAGPDRELLCTEMGNAECALLAEAGDPAAPIQVLRVRPWGTTLFRKEKTKEGFRLERKPLVWSSRGPERAIGELWGVDESTAHQIYVSYLREAYSPRVAKLIASRIAPRVRSLYAELEVMKLRGAVVVDACGDLPFSLPQTRKGLKLFAPGVLALGERLGFSFTGEAWPTQSMAQFRLFAPLSDHFFRRYDVRMSEWLSDHLHWLGAPRADRRFPSPSSGK